MWNAVDRNKALAALVLFLCLAGAGCRAEPATLKIGLVAPFEGRDRAVGYDAVYAARLAVREINGSGGVAGHAIEVVALDDRGDEELARHAAASLVIDPAVIAVAGHWLPETTTAARALYAENGLALIILGLEPFETLDARRLPEHFHRRYEEVTPFDEVAGPYAGATYDAFYLIFSALELAETSGEISRESVAVSLQGLQYAGVTGTVFQP